MDRRSNDERAPQKPVDEMRDGNLKASIWRNEGENGAFYPTTFARTYKDDQGNLRDASSFAGHELLRVSELARKAYDRTRALRREERDAHAPVTGREQNNRQQDRGKESFKEGRRERPPRQRSRDR